MIRNVGSVVFRRIPHFSGLFFFFMTELVLPRPFWPEGIRVSFEGTVGVLLCTMNKTHACGK